MMNRERLYDRINQRVDNMLQRGLLDEVKRLREMGYGDNAVAMQGLGYKEMLAYLKGELPYDEAVYLLKRDTRRYAKRQLTWFRRNEGIHWIDLDQTGNQVEILKNIEYYIATSGIIL